MRAGFSLALAATVLVWCSGCDRHTFTLEEFSGTDGISLYVKGECVIEYSPGNHQLGFNADKCEFRVCEDNMADYFILTCSEMPVETGQTLKADLIYTTYDDIKSKSGIAFMVTDIDDGSGKIWLWSEAEKIGAVVVNLK